MKNQNWQIFFLLKLSWNIRFTIAFIEIQINIVTSAYILACLLGKMVEAVDVEILDTIDHVALYRCKVDGHNDPNHHRNPIQDIEVHPVLSYAMLLHLL